MAGNDPTINVKINGDSSGLQTELGKASQGVMKAVNDMKARAQQLDLARTLGDSEKMPTLVEGLRKMNGVLGQTGGQITAADSSVMGLAGSLKVLAPAVGLAFAVNRVTAFTQASMAAADAIEDYAKALGIPAGQLVALQASAESFGGSGEKVLTWLQKVRDFQDTIAGGGDGAKGAIEKLAAAGIDGEKWAAMLPTKALQELLQKTDGAATGIGLLNDVLGRNSASEARDAFQDLARNGLDPLLEKYKDLEEANRRLAKAQGDFSSAGGAMRNMGRRIAGSIVSAPDRFLAWMDRDVFGDGPAAATGKTDDQIETERQAAVQASIAAAKKKETDERRQKAQEDAAKRRQGVLDAFFGSEGEEQFRKSIQAEMEGMSNNDMTTSVSQIYKALADNADMFSLKQISDMIFRYKELVKELERRFQRDATMDDKKAALNTRMEQEVSGELKRRQRDMDAITVGTPRLTGIEALGGVMGGTGNYARSMAEAQQKAADIAKNSNEKLAAIKTNTEKAAKALED